MIKLSELLDESDAAEEAKKLGLDFMSFGRYGKNGKVTHKSVDGKLVPIDPSIDQEEPEDYEDYYKNRDMDQLESPDDEQPFVHPDDVLYKNIMNSPNMKQKKLKNFIQKTSTGSNEKNSEKEAKLAQAQELIKQAYAIWNSVQ